MNALEFRSTHRPTQVRDSVMKPFLADMNSLRLDGYSLSQLQRFLALNGVTVSIGTLSKYLSRMTRRPGVLSAPPAACADANAQRVTPSPDPRDQNPALAWKGPPDEMDAVRHARQLLATPAAAQKENAS
jgi:hypothetical protein